MATIRNMIRRSFRQIGIVSANEDISSEDLDIARETMSSLLDSWSTNPNISWQRTHNTYAITTSNDAITLSLRPVRIIDISYNLNNVIFSMTQLDSYDFYRVSVPTAGLPSAWMYNGGTEVKLIGRGNGILSVITQDPLFDISSNIDAQLDFPPGFENAIVYNVAVMLCDEYGRQPTNTLLGYASAAVDSIISPNFRPAQLKLDSGSAFGRGRSNYDPTSLAAIRGGS